MARNLSRIKSLGDYPTPPAYAELFTAWVVQQLSFVPELVFEPTCGQGNFLYAAHAEFAQAQLWGVELQSEHVAQAQVQLAPLLASGQLTLEQGSIFEFDFARVNELGKSLLVLGNPPWVTNSSLGFGSAVAGDRTDVASGTESTTDTASTAGTGIDTHNVNANNQAVPTAVNQQEALKRVESWDKVDNFESHKSFVGLQDHENVAHEVSELQTDISLQGQPTKIRNTQLQNATTRKMRGIEAMTGAGTFDVCEQVILECLYQIRARQLALALLCKTSVAYKILAEMQRTDYPVAEVKLLKYDAQKVFGVHAEACLLYILVQEHQEAHAASESTPIQVSDADSGLTQRVIELESAEHASARVAMSAALTVPVWELNESDGVAFIEGETLLLRDGQVIFDTGGYDARWDGNCPFTWRQGVKHDASKIFELSWDEHRAVYRNGWDETVPLEPEMVYPLLKSSDVSKYEVDLRSWLERTPTAPNLLQCKGAASYHDAEVGYEEEVLLVDYSSKDINELNLAACTRKFLLLTQQRLGADTAHLEQTARLAWAYLQRHAVQLQARQSRIYHGAPQFAMFGIGDYALIRFKVVVSGFYKEPVFKLVASVRPVLLDDTCYFLSFTRLEWAMCTCLLLNSLIVRRFLLAISHRAAKRPFTKKVLQRINLAAVAQEFSWEQIVQLEFATWGTQHLTLEMWDDFVSKLEREN